MDGTALAIIDALLGRNAISKVPRAAAIASAISSVGTSRKAFYISRDVSKVLVSLERWLKVRVASPPRLAGRPDS
jgi:ACT domain-containing protein